MKVAASQLQPTTEIGAAAFRALLSECFFWGTLRHVNAARTAVAACDLRTAAHRLRKAATLARPLVKIFQAVHAMPPDHFRQFRDATGDASAVQSLGWQLLDAQVYGLTAAKASVLAGIPEVQQVAALTERPETALIAACLALPPGPDSEQVVAAATQLDHCLAGWLSFHKNRLAGKRDPSYLPPESRRQQCCGQ